MNYYLKMLNLKIQYQYVVFFQEENTENFKITYFFHFIIKSKITIIK